MVSSVATPATNSERAVSAFFDGVRSLNRAAPQVTKISGPAFRGRHRRQVSSYVKELTQLEKSIRELRAQFTQEPEVAPKVVAKQERIRVAGESPDSARTTLERMAREGRLVPSAQFSNQMNWSRQALSKALGSNRVFYVDLKGDRYFPSFYADPAYQRAQLEAVTKVLGDLPGGAKLQFFLTRKGSLAGATPLEALAQGKLQKVKDVAAAFADMR